MHILRLRTISAWQMSNINPHLALGAKNLYKFLETQRAPEELGVYFHAVYEDISAEFWFLLSRVDHHDSFFSSSCLILALVPVRNPVASL